MEILTCFLVSVLLLFAIIFSPVDAQGVTMTELLSNQNDEVPTFAALDDSDHLGGQRGLKFLVEDPPVILEYHNGPLLSAKITPVYIIWYGTFTPNLQSAVRDFFRSFNETSVVSPSVSSWWNLTSGYKDSSERPATPQLRLVAEAVDFAYSLGQVLNDSDVEHLVLTFVNSTFKIADPQAIYLTLSADDVQVSDFCAYSCASHSATNPSISPEGKRLPYAWVGNSEKKCPGLCAWPYAKPEYGPNAPPLIPPNANVGIDGMIINLGMILSGLVTNPYNSGFYQGDGAAPLEAATACAGSFGLGSYEGYPGMLENDEMSGASFNCHGINGRKFLLPALWDAGTRACTPLS